MAGTNIYAKNQFGEPQNLTVLGGSNSIRATFTVDSTNAAGITGLVAPTGVAVFMNTGTTPATGSPNPNAGFIYIRLPKDYATYSSANATIVSPNSGTPINVTTGTTAGKVYVITSVGTTVAAQWQLLGLPTYITPAVGVAFVATATTTATGTGIIQEPAATGSAISHVEAVGLPTQTLTTIGAVGGYYILQCLAATNSSTTTFKVAAPAAGTMISVTLSAQNVPAPLI